MGHTQLNQGHYLWRMSFTPVLPEEKEISLPALQVIYLTRHGTPFLLQQGLCIRLQYLRINYSVLIQKRELHDRNNNLYSQSRILDMAYH